MLQPQATRLAQDRALRLEKTLARLDIEVTQAIQRGQQSTSRRDRDQAAWLVHHLEQICDELGAENIVQMQDELRLGDESDEVLDALEMILDSEDLPTSTRLVTAWRFLRRPNPPPTEG